MNYLAEKQAFQNYFFEPSHSRRKALFGSRQQSLRSTSFYSNRLDLPALSPIVRAKADMKPVGPAAILDQELVELDILFLDPSLHELHEFVELGDVP